MKIPVTIVTGFLGSGKTTLICSLLKKTPDRRLAVLVNEFGEVSVDGDLLHAAGEDSESKVEIHDLPNGCICCCVQDDFLPMMKRLQERKDEIDHVVIETSGLALPTPVMRALNWAEIRNDFELDSVLTVVDTPLLLQGKMESGNEVPGQAEAAEAETLITHERAVDDIFSEQLENGDVVVLNKIDDLSEDQLLAAEEMVRKKATKVRFLELAHGAELDTRLCMGLKLYDENSLPAFVPHHHGPGGHHHGPVSSTPGVGDAPPEDQSEFDGHAHGEMDDHEHGDGTHMHFHEHDVGWQSFVLHCHESQDAEKVKQAVQKVTEEQPVLRAKGFAVIEGKQHRLVLQAVRTRLQVYYEKEHVHAHDSTVVFIGYHPKRKEAIATMCEITGSKWG
ncbi:MAG: GTP-binding protein [Verrucomicrobiales bacterium]|nr:GTP-binding protein [Verrucomicrobiales bacterium]